MSTDKCVSCGNDVSDLGTQVCEECFIKAGLVRCKKCAYFSENDEFSNMGYCSEREIYTDKNNSCGKSCLRI